MREVIFSVDTGGIVPLKMQNAGVQGEDNATKVIFELDESLLNKSYLLNITDGSGHFFATDFLTLSDGKITYSHPAEVTAVGGICQINLVIKDGDTVMFSYPARLYFEPTAEGTHTVVKYLKDIGDALDVCRECAEDAEESKQAAQSSAEAAADAQTAAETAKASAAESASAAEIAKNEAESAAEAAENAQTAAENAKTSAANSASAAETAKQQAESAKASALQSASTAQTAAGTAAEAAETAGAAAETAEAAAETAVEAAQNVELKANLELTPIDGPFYNGDGWANGIYTVASFVNDSPAAGYTEIKFTPAVNGLVYYNPGETPAALKAGVKVYHKDTGTTRTSLSIIKDVADKANPEVVPDADMGINETPSLMENPDDTGIYELVSYSASSGTMKAYSCIFNPALSCAIGCDAEPIPGTRYYVVCGTNSDGYPTYDFSRIKDVADKQDKLSDDVMSSIAEIPNKANLEFRELTPPTYGGGNEYPNGYYTITLKPDSPGPGYTEVAFTPSVAAIIYYGPNTAVPAGLDTGSTVYVESSSSGFSAFSVVKDVKDKQDKQQTETISMMVDNEVWSVQPTVAGTLNSSFTDDSGGEYYFVTLKDTAGAPLPAGQFKLTSAYNDHAGAVDQIFSLTGLDTGSGVLQEMTPVSFKQTGTDFKLRFDGAAELKLLNLSKPFKEVKLYLSGSVNQYELSGTNSFTVVLGQSRSAFNQLSLNTISNGGTKSSKICFICDTRLINGAYYGQAGTYCGCVDASACSGTDFMLGVANGAPILRNGTEITAEVFY